MTRLDDCRYALLPAFPESSQDELVSRLDAAGPGFASFVVDHGLGPLWHEATGREEFLESRLRAEALYAAQEPALEEIDAVLHQAGINYVVIKGAATRLLLYDNPAIRACYDIDVLVRPQDRVRAASALIAAGFVASAKAANISFELTLTRDVVDIDLHWGLLREGRLRTDPVASVIDRRQRVGLTWMPSNEDSVFVLLVHPAFAKHLARWGMGLHRVTDLARYLRTQPVDWERVVGELQRQGVSTAAWATLQWLNMMTPPGNVPALEERLRSLSPGVARKAWLERWLRSDLSERTSRTHVARLLGFSLLLHDTPGDVVRAMAGRRRAHRRRPQDFAAFADLLAQ